MYVSLLIECSCCEILLQSGWGWGNWSSWGSSVLNTTAVSVGTLTSQVGEGLHQVLETVESGFLAADDAGDDDADVSQREEPLSTDTRM